jgi:hypothetical protein
MLTVLHRIDHNDNIDRWYPVMIQATLFDPSVVVCQCGRLHTTWQRTRVIPLVSVTGLKDGSSNTRLCCHILTSLIINFQKFMTSGHQSLEYIDSWAEEVEEITAD